MTAMRLVVPVWEDRVSPVFDVARRFLVVEVIAGEPSFTEEVPVGRADRAAEVIGLGAGALLCGAISRDIEERLLSSGVEVVAEVRGPVAEVVRAYLEGGLGHPSFSMPGAHGRRRRPRSAAAQPFDGSASRPDLDARSA